MRYKFENFNAEIEPKEWQIESVTDNYNNTCTVNIVLISDTAKFGVCLDWFEYSDTWEDADIEAFIETKLKEYEC